MLRITVSTSAAAAQRYYVRARQAGLLQRGPGDHRRLSRQGGQASQAAAQGECRDLRRADREQGPGDRRDPHCAEGKPQEWLRFHLLRAQGSVAALCDDGDARIKNAFETAVQDTMREIERDMQARVRKDGAEEDRTTGNAVWASFTHYLARPVDGVPDPSLHSHNFMFNMTWDPVEHCWKAGNSMTCISTGTITRRRSMPGSQPGCAARLPHRAAWQMVGHRGAAQSAAREVFAAHRDRGGRRRQGHHRSGRQGSAWRQDPRS